MAEAFRFERRAREPRALALIAGAGLVIAVLLFVVNAAWWLAPAVAVLALPAVTEALRDARFHLALDDRALSWESGRRRQSVPLDRIAEVRLATTLDVSQRATLRLDSGESLRIPPECLPPGRALDAALAARGIPHHRSLFGF
jgi:hypothetical protein